MLGGNRNGWRHRVALAAVATMAVLVVLAGLTSLDRAGAAEAADPPPLVISHRGASSEAPEHTFAAYDKAVEEHTDVLECDLQLTKDDVLVCLHDTTVDRTTGGTAKGRVDSFTLDQLRAMDFGTWFGSEFAGAHIVPFEEQLRCYAKAAPGVQFYAETKAPAEYGGRMEPALVKLLRRLDLVPKGEADVRRAPVIIQSFELESLQSVKELAPSLPTAWLTVAPPATWVDASGKTPAAVNVMAPTKQYLIADPGLVDRVHATGSEVHTWTVDDPAEIDQLLDAGVDGIFSNDTATLRARVDAQTGHSTRPPVKIEPGCPDVAGTVTAATTAARATPTTSAAKDDGEQLAATAADDEDSPWVGIAGVAALVFVIGVLVGFGVWWFKRRRP